MVFMCVLYADEQTQRSPVFPGSSFGTHLAPAGHASPTSITGVNMFLRSSSSNSSSDGLRPPTANSCSTKKDSTNTVILSTSRFGKYKRFADCPKADQRCSSAKWPRRQTSADAASTTLTLENFGVAAGASVCFYRRDGAGVEGGGRALVRRVYGGMTEELVEGMRKLLRGEGPLGRVHLIKVCVYVEGVLVGVVLADVSPTSRCLE